MSLNYQGFRGVTLHIEHSCKKEEQLWNVLKKFSLENALFLIIMQKANFIQL